MARAMSEDPAFLFTHIPKTGGTSLFSPRSRGVKIFRERCRGFTIMRGHMYLRFLAFDTSNYFKFATVRNPYDRFVSLALTRIGIKSVDHFAEEILNRRVRWYQIKPQITWIQGSEGELLTDHLLRFENLRRDVDALMCRFGFPTFRLQHFRRTGRNKDYRLYYKRDKTIEFVNKYYKRDLETFNYSFEGNL